MSTRPTATSRRSGCPQPLTLALGLTAVATLVIGVIPQVVLRYGDLGSFTDAGPSGSVIRRGLVERIRAGGPAARSRPSWRPRSTTPRAASTPPAVGPGAAGDFLTSPEVGPLFGAVLARALDRGGRSSAGPTRSWWSTPGPGPAPWPAPCWPPGRPWPSSRRPPLRRRRAVSGPAGGATPAWPSASASRSVPDEPFVGCRGRQRAARQPALPPPVHDGGWQEASSTSAPDGRLVEVLRPVRRASRPACRPRRPHGARAPVQDEAAALGRATRSARLGRRAARRARLRAARRPTGGPAVAGVAADLPRPRARAGTTCAEPGRAGHHHRGRPRPAPAAARTTSTPGRLPARATASTSWSRRAGGVWRDRAAAPDLAALDRPAAGCARPRRSPTRPASAPSRSPSGSSPDAPARARARPPVHGRGHERAVEGRH